MNSLPSITASKPAIVRRIVDLPQPEGPTNTQNLPSGTSKVMSSIAVLLSNLRVIPCNVSFAIFVWIRRRGSHQVSIGELVHYHCMMPKGNYCGNLYVNLPLKFDYLP